MELLEKDTSEKQIQILEENINQSVLEIVRSFKYSIMRCVNCPILMECKHPQSKLSGVKKDALAMSKDIYEEEIELDNSADNTLRAQNKRDMTYKQYIENRAFDVLKNERCIYEKKEVLVILSKFVDAGYDITDPRAYLIVKELLGNILNSGRANKAFTSLGIILKKETPGGPIYYENPLLKTKMAFSKIIVEATEALDRMLKTDDNQKAEKDFTAHLLQALRIKKKEKALPESKNFDYETKDTEKLTNEQKDTN